MLEPIEGLEDKMVLDGKVKIFSPSEFDVMPKDILESKYPMSRRPTEVYSNENGSISIAINHTKNPLEMNQLSEVLQVFIKQFSGLYPTIKWFRKELTKINGREFTIMEFEVPAIDTDIYNVIVTTSLDNRMLMIAFNCVVELKSDWETKANEIINSIRILEN